MPSKRETISYQISALPTSYFPKIEDYFIYTQRLPEAVHKIAAFNLPEANIKEPKISQWDYLDYDQVKKLKELKNTKDIYEYITTTLSNYPKGRPKDIFNQLLTDVNNFCCTKNYDVEKTATVLSQFYLTHLYFISVFDTTAEKIYLYFKELMMCHSLPFPPTKTKIFAIKEARDIVEFFCRIYLRNLPLIKYLSLPNFALYLNYDIPPPPLITTQTKGKADKKNKKKK